MSILSTSDQEKIARECRFETARSSGKGGQNVNKVESKVTLVFDVKNSAVLDLVQKLRLVAKSGRRIHDGILRMSSEESRSQHQNRQIVIARFFELLEKLLKVPKKRVATKISKAKKEARLKTKKVVKEKKTMRKKLIDEDY